MRKASILVSVTIGLALLWCIVLWVPEWMANQYRFANVNDWAVQVAANRTLLANFIGGAALAITIYFTYGNFKLAQQTVRLTEDKSTTDLFSKSVEQLGNPDMSVRLGGIHSLARIARSSQSDYFPVMQVLTGFLRTRYGSNVVKAPLESTLPGHSQCPVEVQLIATIVGERYWASPDDYYLDFSYVDLCDAWVPRADYRKMYFWYVRLKRWDFQDAKLNDADFKGAILDECDFSDADLTGANFEDAEVRNAKGLSQAQLDTARNVDATLCRPSDGMN